MSWSWEHDWFQKFVESLQPGDKITVYTVDGKIRWTSSKYEFVSPYFEVNKPGDSENNRPFQHQFYVENFVGYTLTLRGLVLSKPQFLDETGENRLSLVEKYGMAMMISGEHADRTCFFEELDRIRRIVYTVIKKEA